MNVSGWLLERGSTNFDSNSFRTKPALEWSRMKRSVSLCCGTIVAVTITSASKARRYWKGRCQPALPVTTSRQTHPVTWPIWRPGWRRGQPGNDFSDI